MVLETLKEDLGHPKNAVLEFNPWQWSGHEQVSEGFFAELERLIGKFDSQIIRFWKRRAIKLRLYASYLNVGGFAARSWKEALGFFVGSGAVVLFGNSSLVTGSAFKWISLVVGGVGIVVSGCKLLGNLFESAAETYLRRVDYAGKSLTEIKSALAQAFKELERPVIVVLDDIDRLSGDEIRCVFQLVKANANFPNLIYLLLFERGKVEASLSHSIEPHFGREYLAKIVQVGFDLGTIERPTLDSFLKIETDQLLLAAGSFDQERWLSIFDDFALLFRNLRDVYRFLGTAEFHIGLFREQDTLQVDVIDLLTLEALRVFEPNVYQQIPMYKNSLLGLTAFKEDDQRSEQEKAIKALSKIATDTRRLAVEGILKVLFPRSPSETDYDQWLRDYRVCISHAFDLYFLLAMPTGSVSKRDVEQLVNVISNRREFVAKVAEYHSKHQLLEILDRLLPYANQIDLKHAQAVTTAVFDAAEYYEERRALPVTNSSTSKLSVFLLWFLRREANDQRRASVLHEAIQKTTGLILPVQFIAADNSRSSKSNAEPLIQPSEMPRLKQACVEMLRKAAASPFLADHNEMAFLLGIWVQWAPPIEAQEWVLELTSTKEGLLRFLRAFLGRRNQGTDSELRAVVEDERSIMFAAFNMQKLIDPIAMGTRLKEHSFTQEEQTLVERYYRSLELKAALEAQQRKAQEKPDSTKTV